MFTTLLYPHRSWAYLHQEHSVLRMPSILREVLNTVEIGDGSNFSPRDLKSRPVPSSWNHINRQNRQISKTGDDSWLLTYARADTTVHSHLIGITVNGKRIQFSHKIDVLHDDEVNWEGTVTYVMCFTEMITPFPGVPSVSG